MKMIERVARALFGGADEDGWERALDSTRAEYLGIACVAIEAMREPTPEMVAYTLPLADPLPLATELHDPDATVRLAERASFLAGKGVDHARGVECAHVVIRDWRAMIAAALGEGEELTITAIGNNDLASKSASEELTPENGWRPGPMWTRP